MTKVSKIGHLVKRDAAGIPCECGGYAERVSCTGEEIEKLDCNPFSECCSRAFVCKVCGNRLVGWAEPPGME